MNGLAAGLAKEEPLLNDPALLPQGLGHSIHGKRYPVHGVAQQHPQKGNGVLRGVPGIVGNDDGKGKKGHRKRGDKHGAGSQQPALETSDSSMLTNNNFPPGNSQHHHGDGKNKKEAGIGKENPQDLTDKEQLDGGTQGGDCQPFFQTETHTPAEDAQQQDQSCGKTQIKRAQRFNTHLRLQGLSVLRFRA